MEGFNPGIVLLIIIFLIFILDILRNMKFMQSEKMVIAGTLSYISVLAFFTCYVFIPSNTFLLITIITLGLIPNSYYWYNRTTKGERRKEALILAVLILAGMMYYLTRIF